MARFDWTPYYGKIRDIMMELQTLGIRNYTECGRVLLERNSEIYDNLDPEKIDRIGSRIGEIVKSVSYNHFCENEAIHMKAHEKIVKADKKEREPVHWTELSDLIESHQKVKHKLDYSQDYLKWECDTDEPIVIMCLGDTQLGSFGTNYKLFKTLTEEILSTPNLYVLLMGDILQLAVKMRGVAEVLDNAISPSMQYYWLKTWLDDIKEKVIGAVWCNHQVMREENQLGYSVSADIYGERVPYFKNIGHIDMHVGEQVYKVAVSHKYQGKSMYNKAHAPMRYMREKANDREIAIQGDYHQPGILMQEYGGVWRCGIVCGSIQTNSTYAKRFFSLKTLPNMPCITLDPKEHVFNAYSSLGHYLKSMGKYHDVGGV